MSNVEQLRSWFATAESKTVDGYTPFSGGDYVAIDFETANEKRASACAIGIAVVKDGAVVHKKAWLLRPPEMRFNRRNISIHGIRPEDVADAPRFPELWPHLLHYIEGRVVIAHNAGFDISVLRHTLDAYSLKTRPFDYSCTYAISRSVWPDLRNHRLSSVAEHIGHTMTHHDPGDDAEAAARIALGACSHLGHDSLESLVTGLKLRRHRFRA